MRIQRNRYIRLHKNIYMKIDKGNYKNIRTQMRKYIGKKNIGDYAE